MCAILSLTLKEEGRRKCSSWTEQTERHYVVFGVLNRCFGCLPTALIHKTLDKRVTRVTEVKALKPGQRQGKVKQKPSCGGKQSRPVSCTV